MGAVIGDQFVQFSDKGYKMTTPEVTNNLNNEKKMEKQCVTLHIRSDIALMLIDGLRVLIEQWEYTADYIISGMVRDDVLCRDCNDPNEARMIAEDYENVLQSILKQFREQSEMQKTTRQ